MYFLTLCSFRCVRSLELLLNPATVNSFMTLFLHLANHANVKISCVNNNYNFTVYHLKLEAAKLSPGDYVQSLAGHSVLLCPPLPVGPRVLLRISLPRKPVGFILPSTVVYISSVLRIG